MFCIQTITTGKDYLVITYGNVPTTYTVYGQNGDTETATEMAIV